MKDQTELFVTLTASTCPHGNEIDFIDILLQRHCNMDVKGNFYLKIGESRSMFACHLDTVGAKKETVNHVIDGRYIKTDGTTILGADDKAGMVVLLNMIDNNIPGLYYFFVGEESGGIGSGYVCTLAHDIDRVVSFDRGGTSSIISNQAGGQCCSNRFINALSDQFYNAGHLFMYGDTGGTFTDSAKFIYTVHECTNVSVGYFHQHSNTEILDIGFLNILAESCLYVNWESLPIARPLTVETKYDYKENKGYKYNKYEKYESNRYHWWDKESKVTGENNKYMPATKSVATNTKKTNDSKPIDTFVQCTLNDVWFPKDSGIWSLHHKSWIPREAARWSSYVNAYVHEDFAELIDGQWVPDDWEDEDYYSTYDVDDAGQLLEIKQALGTYNNRKQTDETNPTESKIYTTNHYH